MNWHRLATASVLSILGGIINVSLGAAPSQLVARPYDAEAVRKAAAEIQREIKKPRHEEEALAGPLQFIVESLSSLNDLKDVPDEVLDAVVALAGTGRMASETLIRFGDRAVNPLIRATRTRSPDSLFRSGAMFVLQEMLLRRTTGHGLSPESTAGVRALVRDLLKDQQLDYIQLTALGRLAVATGDPELRTAAERLTNPTELTSRGVPAARQADVISMIRRALDTFPRLPSPAPEPARVPSLS